MAEKETKLTDELFEELQNEKFVLLHTTDTEVDGPTSSAISWVYAVNSSTLRIAVDQRSRLIANIKKNNRVAVTVFASGSVYEILGSASLITEALDDVPFKLSCIDVNIDSFRDAMFYGAKISTEPVYEKTYDARAAEKLDNQVFSSMKKT